ncbi:hypothetical protein WN51_06163 [Melipona quadrifasciata]|uniref:Uncharacterized protein n=1 Tax=Melipona quadrifasciata TaxID=166423 RepID=A0A0M8ZRV8_9HYME|nr:hypothetical protein WN51_06163 [Melipona quadrifasciata]
MGYRKQIVPQRYILADFSERKTTLKHRKSKYLKTRLRYTRNTLHEKIYPNSSKEFTAKIQASENREEGQSKYLKAEKSKNSDKTPKIQKHSKVEKRKSPISSQDFLERVNKSFFSSSHLDDAL